VHTGERVCMHMYVCMYLCHKEYTSARTHELALARTCPRAHTLIHTHTHTQMKTFMGIVGFSVVNASIHDARGSISGTLPVGLVLSAVGLVLSPVLSVLQPFRFRV